jgi:thiol-disulfide isomerase/thioredoxin
METVNVIWIGIGILFLLAITYYIYKNFLKKDKKAFVPNDEYVDQTIKYECILFYTEWCPHCKKTLDDWADYKNTFSDTRAKFTLVDCDKQKDKAEIYGIDSYPTIVMVLNGKNYVFDSNFSKESMDKFVSTILKI